MTKIIKFIFVLVLFIVFVRLLNPTLHFAGDLNYSYKDEVMDQLRFPQAWNSRGSAGFGESTVFVLWQWPLTVIYSTFTALGLPFDQTINIFGYLLAIVIAYFSVKKVTSKLKLSEPGIYSAGLLYAVNTYFLLLLDGGQLSIGLAYAFIPYCYSLVLDSVRSDFSSKIKAGLSITLLGYLDIRFVYLLLIVFVLRFVFFEIYSVFNNKSLFIEWILSASVITGTFVVLNIYWILPLLIFRLPALPQGYASASQNIALSFANFGHSMLLLQPNWYKNIFGQVTQLLPAFYLIPIAVYSVVFIAGKNREIKFWLILSLVGIFLAKGTNEPFGNINSWIFLHIPGFSLFRDSTKFYVFIALSYSILFALLMDAINKKHKKIAMFAFSAFSIYLLYLINPVWSGKMTGAFSLAIYRDEYDKFAKTLANDNAFGRVLWIPSKTSLGYSSPSHPSVELTRVFGQRPFATGVVGTYETSNFIRESPYMGQLFDVFGLKYIAYPYPDYRRQDLKEEDKKYYYSFLDQISNLPWTNGQVIGPPVPLIESKSTHDRFFVSPSEYFVVGSDSFYNEPFSMNGFELSKNSFKFLEQNANSYTGDLGNKKVILYKKTKLDLIGSLIESTKMVFPASYLSESPDGSAWWKRGSSDFLWVRNFLQQKYGLDNTDFDMGAGYAVSEGNNELLINNPNFKAGEILLARILMNNDGGSISFSQNGSVVGEAINTKATNSEKVTIKLSGYKDIPDQYFNYDDSQFHWFKIGKLTQNGNLKIITNGGINILNAVASVPEDYLKQIENYADTVDMVNYQKLNPEQKRALFSLSDYQPQVDYRRLSSTHYKVSVKGVNEPMVLVFSDSYDPNWTASLGGKSIKSEKDYGLVNSFDISGDGEYDIFYTPQKYVDIGLAISVTGLFALLSILFLGKIRLMYNQK